MGSGMFLEGACMEGEPALPTRGQLCVLCSGPQVCPQELRPSRPQGQKATSESLTERAHRKRPIHLTVHLQGTPSFLGYLLPSLL